jgi:hypothetical protein
MTIPLMGCPWWYHYLYSHGKSAPGEEGVCLPTGSGSLLGFWGGKKFRGCELYEILTVSVYKSEGADAVGEKML